MAERTIEFGALYLLDDADLADALLAERLDMTEVGCLAPDVRDESAFVPGFLVVNYLFGFARFRGFKVARRQALYRAIFQAPLLAGVAGVLAVLIGFIIYMGDSIYYDGLLDVGLVPLGLWMVGGSIVAALVLLGVFRLDTSTKSLEVTIPPSIMSGFVAHYDAARDAVAAAGNAPEPPSGLGTSVAGEIAGGAVGSVAAAFVPAGLADLTGHLVSEHGKGDTADARRDAAKKLASNLQRLALLQAHRDLTGRAALAIEPTRFRAMGSIFETDLLAMRDVA